MRNESEELADLPDQIIGIAGGHQSMHSGLGSRPSSGSGREVRRPLGEFRRYRGEQHPGTGRPSAAARSGPGRKDGCRSPERRQVRLGVAIDRTDGALGFEQSLPGLFDQRNGSRERRTGPSGAGNSRGHERGESGHDRPPLIAMDTTRSPPPGGSRRRRVAVLFLAPPLIEHVFECALQYLCGGRFRQVQLVGWQRDGSGRGLMGPVQFPDGLPVIVVLSVSGDPL